MAGAHPYTTSQGGLVQTINQFRQAFPAVVDAATLRKLGFAPNNESYILNVLRFLSLVDGEGKKTADAAKIFNQHDDALFSSALAAQVRAAYKSLFDLRQEAAWDLDGDALISFFRGNDGTSAIVAKRQAATFQLLAAFSGHGEVPEPKAAAAKGSGKRGPVEKKPSAKKALPTDGNANRMAVPPGGGVPVGLSVRVEINLPADGDQTTYDRIFKSIRENLLNG